MNRRTIKFVVPIVVLVIILVIVAVSVLRSRSRPPEGTILANGTVEATEIDVSSKVVGHVLRLTVDEGDEVRAGQVIAVLDGDEIKAQVEQARGSYESAKARLADLERGSRVEQIRQARAGVAQAQAAAEGARRALAIAEESFAKSTELRGQLVNAQAAYNAAGQAYKEAQARLALVEAGSRPEEIQQARAGVDQARSQAVKARQDAARAEGLFAAGAISAQQRDAAVAARDSAEAALAAAEARLAELQAGSRPEEREQARAAAAQARAQLEGASRSLQVARQLYSDRLVAKQQVEAAQTQYRTALDQVAAARAQLDLLIAGPTKQSIEAARGQVEQARGQLEQARAMTSYLVVKAPTSGTVILKIAEQGELVTVGEPIVRLANLDSVWVRVYVPEPDLRVRIGDRAYVTTDAYPGKRYYGRVTEIAQTPEFTPKNVQTREERVKLVFGVKVQLENPRHELKPGMPADATIYVGEKKEEWNMKGSLPMVAGDRSDG